MITFKTEEEIEFMRQGGARLKKVMAKLVPLVKAGMTTGMIDEEAQRLLLAEHVDISFNKVKGYRWATCVPVNDQVVHTPPGKRILKDGDILTIDIGAYFKNLHTDHATTFIIGSGSKSLKEFLDIGKKTLYKAIEVARVGQRIGLISKVIEENIEGNGFFIMKQLTGHGVGRELHEDPLIPGFLDRPIEKTMVLKAGMTIAIEVIYSMGTDEIAYEKGDKWSIVTADGSISACFEHTIAITDKNTVILT